MRIIFMGTPQFAVASLDILVQNGLNVVAVITATDKPAGRGKKLSESPVKKYALAHDIPILQPKNLKSKKFLATLASYQADLQVVVAFRILPEVVFDMPPLKSFNLHASLLPQYRGAAPINWAVMNGEKESGITTFFIQKHVDTGKIIYQDKVAITDEMNAGELHDNLMERGAELVLKTVKAIEAGDYPQEEQVIEGELKKAPKIFKEDCEIDWSKTTEEIYNHIRGLSPYPAAFTFLGNKRLKVFKTEKEIAAHDLEGGSLKTDEKTFLKMATADGFIHLKEIQLEGKSRSKIENFLRGYRFS